MAPIEKQTFKHRELTPKERDNLVDAFHASEERYKSAAFMKTFWGFLLCTVYIHLSVIAGFYVINKSSKNIFELVYLVACVLVGFLYLTLKFGAHHMWAHSMFLCYDEWKIGGASDNLTPVFFYAFYHHHSSVDWCKELSIRNHKIFVPDTLGIRGVVSAHWHGYSMLFNLPLLVFAVLSALIDYRVTLAFFLGHEMGVYLLPAGHGWQHLKPETFPLPLRLFFSGLEMLGVYSNNKLHKTHHKHTHKHVYQSFTSSGLYSKKLDDYFDRIWNQAFDGYQPLQDIETFYYKAAIIPLLVSIIALISIDKLIF